jgi:hypothetical protein
MVDQLHHGGPTRRLLTGVLRCGRCGARLVAAERARHYEDWALATPDGPYTRQDRIERQPRYICPTGHLAILAAPSEHIIAAAVAHRRGVALPTGRERQRAAVAATIERVDVLSARPGQNLWTPERLRLTWRDGTVTQGAGPLDRRSPVPRPQWSRWPTHKELDAANEVWNRASWAAVWAKAGAALA